MKFIIWTGSYDENSGGIIALHLLCSRLNQIGHTAMLWPAGLPSLRGRFGPGEALRAARWEVGRLRRLGRPTFSTGPFNNAVATRRDLEGAVVVYPEVADGNPLRAEHVVRWLLHRPGFHTGSADFGKNDLFFHYQDGFKDSCRRSSQLTLSWLNPAYKDLGETSRTGSTYLLRKGRGRALVHDLSDSVCVDDMRHEERAAAFNRARYFYSYDLYTMYSRYAAICGAVPIIVPDPATSKDEWVPREEDRYGLAYGEDEIDWAVATRGKLFERLSKERADEDRMLEDFVARCGDAWGAL